MPKTIQNVLWLAVFTLWVAFFGFQILVASQEIPAEQQAYRASTAQSDPGPPVLGSINQGHPEKQTDQRKTKEAKAGDALKEFSIKFFELKLTDILIAIFTIVLAVKTSGLFRETAGLRESAAEQSRDMKDSIAAAQKSAAAAEKSAAVAESALVDLERPYVVPGRPILQCYRYGEPGMGYSEPPIHVAVVDYRFFNMGRTPGFIKEITAELIFAPSLPDQPIFSSKERRTLFGHFPVKNDGLYECPKYGLADKIPGGIYDKAASNDSMNFYFFGYIKYSDVFGYLHTHGFCFHFFNLKHREVDAAVTGSDKYNYERTEKIPPGGFRDLAPRGAEMHYPSEDKL